MKTEKWMPVVGYEGIYEVSESGLVKSLFRKKLTRANGVQYVPEKILTPRITMQGYCRVGLNLPSRKQKGWSVHRLVALAFIPNPEGKPQVNHKDGVKTNNHVSNLEWSTAHENIRHRINVLNIRIPPSKLTADKVRQIRKLNGSAPCQEIADRFSISISHFFQITSRRVWGWLK